MDPTPISLQLMDPNCKPIHARTYTAPRSVEQELQNSKKIVRLVDIGVLEEETDFFSERASPSFSIPKKNGILRVVTDFMKTGTQLIVEMSPISYSKYRGLDQFKGSCNLCFRIGLKYMGYYHIKLDSDAQKLCIIVFLCRMKIQIQTLTHGISRFPGSCCFSKIHVYASLKYGIR
jgi:hypothetical protein